MNLGQLTDSWAFAFGLAAVVHLAAGLAPLRPEPRAPLEFIDIELAEPIVEPPPEPEPEEEPEPPPPPELPPGELNEAPEADPTKTSAKSNRPVPDEGEAEPAPLVTGLGIDAESLVEEGQGLAVRVGNTDEAGFDAPGVDPTELTGFVGEGRGGGEKIQTALSAVDNYKPPKIVRDVRPPYPPSLKADDIEGHVVLRIQVLANGRAGQVDLISATHPEFAEVAQVYVRRFRWRPARIGREKVEGWTRLTIRFELTDEDRR